MTSDNVKTVQEIYQAFGRGDVGTILERVTDDIAWEAWPAPSAQRTSIPWLRERHGKDGVREFFGALGSAREMSDFQVLALLADENMVAAQIAFDATDRASGRAVHVDEMHLWSFAADGRVTAYRDYVDTATEIPA